MSTFPKFLLRIFLVYTFAYGSIGLCCTPLIHELAVRLAPNVPELQSKLSELIKAEIDKVPKIKRRAFISAIENSDIRPIHKTGGAVNPAGNWLDRLFKMVATSQISLRWRSEFSLPNKLQKTMLSFSNQILNHPSVRITIVHEFSHLRRLINAHGGSDFKAYMKIMYTKKGLLEEERLAFGDEYDYLRSFIDTQKGIDEFEQVTNEVLALVNHPLLSEDSPSNYKQNRKIEKTLVNMRIKLQLGIRYLQKIDSVKEMTRDEYIDRSVDQSSIYQKKQEELIEARNDNLKEIALMGVQVGSFIALNYLAWEFLF